MTPSHDGCEVEANYYLHLAALPSSRTGSRPLTAFRERQSRDP
jgi:hypothetical protein